MSRVNGFMFTNGLSGKAGNAVFVTMPDGRVFLRPRVVPRDPQTSKQLESRRLLSAVARVFASLTPSEFALWETYASKLSGLSHREGLNKTRRPSDVFTSLGYRFLQVNPGGAVPRVPPSTEFSGDSVVVSVLPGAVSFSGSSNADSHPGPSGPASVTPGIGVRASYQQLDDHQTTTCRQPEDHVTTPLFDPVITFTANQPNGAGVTTELLIQPVRSLNTKPRPDKFRSKGFVEFADGSLQKSVPVKPGVYACAIRFVRAETGQAGGVVYIGSIKVD